MKLCDIRVRKSFRSSRPSKEKMEACRNYFKEHGTLDRDIIINEGKILIDGYIGYLVLKENDIEEWDVKAPSVNTENVLLLVAGKHRNNEKVYYWIADAKTKGLYGDISEETLSTYKRASVDTKYGQRKVDVVGCTVIKSPELVCEHKHINRLYR